MKTFSSHVKWTPKDFFSVSLSNHLLLLESIDLDFTKVVEHGERQVLLDMDSPIIADTATIILSSVNLPTPEVDSFKL